MVAETVRESRHEPKRRQPAGSPTPYPFRKDETGKVTLWAIDVELKPTPDGRRNRRKLYGKTRLETSRRAAQFRRLSTQLTTPEDKPPPIENVLDWWLTQKIKPLITPHARPKAKPKKTTATTHTEQANPKVSSLSRTRFQKRRQLLENFMSTWPRTPTGKLARGFWPSAFELVKAEEEDQAPSDQQALRQWWLYKPS